MHNTIFASYFAKEFVFIIETYRLNVGETTALHGPAQPNTGCTPLPHGKPIHIYWVVVPPRNVKKELLFRSRLQSEYLLAQDSRDENEGLYYV
jgi:hypothetical protein